MIKSVELTHNNKCLRGMLHIPEEKKDKYPIVIMFHGFGANKIEYMSSFVKMSNVLSKEGIAVIRFDLSGHGESDGDFIDVTLSEEIAEGKAIVDFVKTLDFVDKCNINLLGMSFGGVVSSIVASEKNMDINALCMWAPAAAAQDEININKTIQGEKITNIQEKGYIDFKSNRISIDFIKDMGKYDIYERARLFDKNVKIIHGAKDFIAPISYSKKYIKDIYGNRGELYEMEESDHSFGSYEERKILFRETLEFFKKEQK